MEAASPNNPDPINFYGMIIDASHPYKSKERCISTLKVVDPTLFIRDNDPQNYATVIIYAKRVEDLPQVNQIGDMIRIHRSNPKLYKE